MNFLFLSSYQSNLHDLAWKWNCSSQINKYSWASLSSMKEGTSISELLFVTESTKRGSWIELNCNDTFFQILPIFQANNNFSQSTLQALDWPKLLWNISNLSLVLIKYLQWEMYIYLLSCNDFPDKFVSYHNDTGSRWVIRHGLV